MSCRFLLLLFAMPILFCVSCQELERPNSTKMMPAPTGDIPIFSGHKEGEGIGDKRRAWFDMMHRTAPGVDWKKMDRRFRNEAATKRSSSSSKTQEAFAGGVLDGEWLERGSLNQAGNLESIQYKQSSDEVYGISGGGTLWKSKLDGSTWQSLNENLQFETKILALIDKPSTNRVLTCQGKQVYYSDDDGATWSLSNGLNFTSDWGFPVDLQVTSTGDIYYLSFTWDNAAGTSEMWLFYSNNNGNSFTKTKEFEHGQDYWEARNFTRLWVSKRIPEAYVVHLGSEIYSLNNGSLNQLIGVNGLPINTTIDIEGSIENNSLKNLYVLSERKDIYRSQDGGQNWNLHANTTKNTWDVGIHVKEWDDSVMLFGEVECYRSANNGNSWSRINTWGSYYSNIDRLHADIMDIKFYEKSDGTDFVLVANHGGLHVSYNDGSSFENISKIGLNIGQYYDVRTDPTDLNIIYAGSQDQGHQRTTNGNSYQQENYEQVISGDYGEMAFSRNGNSMWTNYPGTVHYYQNPKTGFVNQTYNIPGDDKAVVGWIAPTCATTEPSDRSVYVGGGNINGGTGSHLIKLTTSVSAPYQISATQFDFDFKANSDSGSSTISAIANSPVDENRLYVSTADGTFFYSNDKGESWTKTSNFSGPDEIWIIGTTILPSKMNPDRIWLGGSGYSNPGVYVSEDGGDTFSPMANGLPNTLVYDLDANDDESLIFAGTELGPYVFVTAQNMWHPLIGQSAPLQIYNSVEYVSSENIIRFGTYGRGVWDFLIDRSCEIYTSTFNPVINDTFIQVNQTITSSSLISENLNVTFDAGESIDLLEGFEVEPNSIFEALINGCN